MLASEGAHEQGTCCRAPAHGDLAPVECADAVTDEPRRVIGAIAWAGARFAMTPFGHLAPGNPWNMEIGAVASLDEVLRLLRPERGMTHN